MFSDGLARELDFAGSLPGMLATVDEDSVFATASVDPVAGTVSWPTGVDLDPDVLHGDYESAGAVDPRLVSEYRLQAARCSCSAEQPRLNQDPAGWRPMSASPSLAQSSPG